DFGKAFVQAFCSFIAPTALGHEGIPHFDFLVARLGAMGKCPLKQFVVAAALDRFGFESCVVDFQKLAASEVKFCIRADPSRRSPALRQFSLLKQPNFVQHTSEINNPFDLIVWAPQPRYNRWI